jgi:hypothetical protein
VVAWHRALIEDWDRERAAPREELAERLSALGWYAQVAGRPDPFTNHVLGIPVGELDEPLYLGAHWRIETAAGIAWALGLAKALPPAAERCDDEALMALFPLYGDPPGALRAARLGDRADIARELAVWKAQTAGARRARDESGAEPAALAFSRAFERARGLAWVLGDEPSVEDAPFDA